MAADFAEYLNRKFIEYETEHGSRRQIREFAEHLGISQAQMSQYMNRTREPSPNTVKIIAKTLGNKAYDVVGLARPDPRVQEILDIYDKIPPENLDELVEWIIQFAEKHGIKPGK